VTAGRKPGSDMPVTWSNQEGEYELTGLPSGQATLTFQQPDYAPAVRDIDLNAGRTATWISR